MRLMNLFTINVTTYTKDNQSYEEQNFPRFLVVALKDGQPIKQSIFGIQKILKCAVGEVKEAKKIRNGNVLIEVYKKSQANNALAIHTWVDQSIVVTPHRSLNTSRGVIRCREFDDCDDGKNKYFCYHLRNSFCTEIDKSSLHEACS